MKIKPKHCLFKSPPENVRLMHLFFLNPSGIFNTALNNLLYFWPVRTFSAFLDKASRPISNVIWVLSSDTICQLNQLFSNSEVAMLSNQQEDETPIGLCQTGSKDY